MLKLVEKSVQAIRSFVNMTVGDRTEPKAIDKIHYTTRGAGTETVRERLRF